MIVVALATICTIAVVGKAFYRYPVTRRKPLDALPHFIDDARDLVAQGLVQWWGPVPA